MRIEQDPALTICGMAGDAARALRELERLRPDLVIVDINLPDSHGLDLIKEIHTRDPKVYILVFSMHDEELFGERALRAGARGYVTKSAAPERVLEAIHRVLAGRLAVSDELSHRLMTSATGRSKVEKSPIQQLSDREMEVFQLLGEGLGTKQIAERLKRSSKTIDTYRLRIKVKLKVDSATKLVVQAARWVAEAR